MIENWGVRARITLVAVLPTLVLTVLLTVFYATLRLAELEDSYYKRGSALTRHLVGAGEYSVFSGNLQALQQLTNAIAQEDGVLGVLVFDRFGETLAHSGTLVGLEVLQVPQNTSSSIALGEFIRFSKPIRTGSLDIADDLFAVQAGNTGEDETDTLGYIVLDLSLARMSAQQKELLTTGATTGAMVLLAALMLAFWMARSVSNPIRQIAHTVNRIGKGHFDERARIMGGGSLRSLAEGVNEMADELAVMHAQMHHRIAAATAELQARKEEAEQANMAKSRFLAAASHDLRQPMHALGLFIAELGQHRLEARPHRLLDQIAASAGAIETLMDRLLDISKLDAGVMQPSIRGFPLKPVLERITRLQKHVATEHGITLRLHAIDCWVSSDTMLFERIIFNLLNNAFHHGNGGRVLLACRRRGDRIVIEVRDNGPGIPIESQNIVFQEFVQLHNPGRSRDQGLGLGLAIVRRLSDLLGLDLNLRSAPGKGSVFSISLPLVPEVETLDSRSEKTRESEYLQGLRIALIENDPLVLSAMESLLDSWGCTVFPGTKLEDLLAVLPSNAPPDIVISDYRLSKGSGLEALAALRKRYGAALPVALVSGDTAPEVLRRCQQAGVPLLHKPVRPARLRAFLSHSISRAD